jgi:hypothetical protein
LQQQDVPNLLRSILEIHRREPSGVLRRECCIRPKPPCAPLAVGNSD